MKIKFAFVIQDTHWSAIRCHYESFSAIRSKVCFFFCRNCKYRCYLHETGSVCCWGHV